MEENKNYAFKFEPEKKEMSFKDSNGTSKMTMEGNGAPLGGDFASNNYTIANHMTRDSKGKTRVKSLKAPSIARDNIGPGSSGFAGVAVLASIIAIAGIIIAYLTLRY